MMIHRWPRNGSSFPTLGVTAFSGNDGIHVFINSLALDRGGGEGGSKAGRHANNEILATRKTDDAGHVLFEAGLARGEGGLSPAMITVMRREGRLRLPEPEDQRLRPEPIAAVAGRAVPAGADASSMRSAASYRSNETVYLTALVRDGQGNAVTRRAADPW